MFDSTASDTSLRNTAGKQISWEPSRVAGALGEANNVFACAYLSFIVLLTFWPYRKDVKPATINWSILVTVVVTVFRAVYFTMRARSKYIGPVIEIDGVRSGE